MIDSLDKLIAALGNGAQALVINKASISSQIAGGFTSLWRATGTPAQGAIPTAAAECVTTTTGAFKFNAPTGGNSTYLGRLMLLSANSATDIQVHDRLAAMGGLSGTVTTAQTVNVDVSTATNNIDVRKGGSDYSDVQWWLEWYTATGSTAVTATVTYTNAAGTTGKTTTVAMAASIGASRMLPILGSGGEFIRSVQTVTLSGTTATAGNFGVSATRALGGIALGLANSSVIADWAMLGLPKIEDSACLMMLAVPGTTSSGALYGAGKLIQG